MKRRFALGCGLLLLAPRRGGRLPCLPPPVPPADCLSAADPGPDVDRPHALKREGAEERELVLKDPTTRS